MKTFKVTVAFSHESFGGYNHKDGTSDYFVQAKNSKSAKNKVKKYLSRNAPNYQKDFVSVSDQVKETVLWAF